jgi:hypothetical protein
VVIAGPFTREGGEADWLDRLRERLGVIPEFHFVWCHPDVRKARLTARGKTRDLPKLGAWESYIVTCREEPPVFPHHWIDTTADPGEFRSNVGSRK